MRYTEAYRILGIAPEDSEVEIKRKYRKLMMIYHPDASGENENLRMSQEINEAYRFLRTHKKLPKMERNAKQWHAEVNPYAYSERSIFVDYSFLDKRIPIRKVAYGRYLWDPYIEEFSMLAKSVSETVTEILEGHFQEAWRWGIEEDMSSEIMMEKQIRLFHLLMQEYIEPVKCIRKLGSPTAMDEVGQQYEFVGAVGISDEHVLQYLTTHKKPQPVFGREQDSRILLYNDSGMVLGNLSYDDDSYYYVVNPVIAGNVESAEVMIVTGPLHTDRRDLNFKGKLDIRILVTLDDNVKGRPRCNASQVKKVLEE